MDDPVSNILSFSVSSRLTILLLQLVSNLILPDHDADVFNPPVNTSTFGLLDSAVHLVLGGVRRWDAIYFTHIMQYGYSYENCIAFFPFFPWFVAFFANILAGLHILELSSCILLTSVIVNIILFALCAVGLYRLGKTVLKDDRIAYYAALFFCINPASIFMTAPYSEVLYFFTLIMALNGLNANAKYAASFIIGLGVFTRSNGLIGTAFVLHSIAKSFIASSHYLFALHRKSRNRTLFARKVIVLGLKAAMEMIVCTILCVLPFFAFQYYTYLKFCQSLSDESVKMEPALAAYGRERGYHLQGDDPSSWCHDRVPLSYSYIQREHWGVGFLRYYTWVQVPNFLLALPIICLSLRACHHFLNLDRKAALYLGLWDFRALALHRALMCKKVDSFEADEVGSGEPSSNGRLVAGTAREELDGMEQPKVPQNLLQLPSVGDTVVFSVHLLALVVFGCLFVHIQVLTRLLCSSSPLLYWYCGYLYVTQQHTRTSSDSFPVQHSSGLVNLVMAGLTKLRLHFLVTLMSSWHGLSLEIKCISVYFASYIVVGTVMFSNFLPWT